MTEFESPESIVQRQLDAYNARDVEALMGTYSEDIELFEHPDKRLASGAAQVRERQAARLSEPNLHAKLLNRMVMGNIVVDHEIVTRTFAEGTGTVELIAKYEVRDGRIRKAWFLLGDKNLTTAKPIRQCAITGIDHIQLAMPPGQEDAARRFFGEVLGMEEEAKPQPLASRGGCWFRAGQAIVHLGVENSFIVQQKAHPALGAANVETMAQTLITAGYPVTWDRELPGRRRFYTADPFGNRIEIIQQGDGFGQK